MRKAQVRSTTCTSAAALALVVSLVPAAVQAACFERQYTSAHLAGQPRQGVAAIRLFMGQQTGDGWPAVVEARMARQGQARRDGVTGRALVQSLWCSDGGAEAVCVALCDGDGDLDLVFDARGRLRLGTARLRLTDQPGRCGGLSDLSEGGRTVYLLDEAAPSACRHLEGL